MATEIERKFLIKNSKWIAITPKSSNSICQGYLAVGEGDVQPEVRVRLLENTKDASSTAFLTVKGKGTLSRKEVETPIDIETAKDLLGMCAARTLEKDRHCLEISGNVWEVDVYKGSLSGLMVVEVELSSEDQHLDIPSWVGQEITEDKRFKNANLVGMRWYANELIPANPNVLDARLRQRP